jgi:hypothetical protein
VLRVNCLVFLDLLLLFIATKQIYLQMMDNLIAKSEEAVVLVAKPVVIL